MGEGYNLRVKVTKEHHDIAGDERATKDGSEPTLLKALNPTLRGYIPTHCYPFPPPKHGHAHTEKYFITPKEGLPAQKT